MVKYNSEIYKRKRESQLAASKRYYEANRVRRLEYQKEYDDNHREGISQRHKENIYHGGKLKTKMELVPFDSAKIEAQ